MITTMGTSQPFLSLSLSLSPNPTNTPGTQFGPDGAGSDEAASQDGADGAEEADSPSAEEVAERVYRLFCQDLRQMRERQGRW